jgi:hypothetical protein
VNYIGITDPREAVDLKRVDYRSSPLYLGKGWDLSSWNKLIFSGLASDILQESKDKFLKRERVDEVFLATELMAQLRTSRGIWSKARPKEGETRLEQKERVLRTIEQGNLQAKMYARKTAVSPGSPALVKADSAKKEIRATSPSR